MTWEQRLCCIRNKNKEITIEYYSEIYTVDSDLLCRWIYYLLPDTFSAQTHLPRCKPVLPSSGLHSYALNQASQLPGAFPLSLSLGCEIKVWVNSDICGGF